MGRIILLSFICLLIWNTSYANVSMPAIFGNHMVLQQNAEVPIWGWAKRGEMVNVTGSWDNKTYRIQPSPNGDWSIKIKTPAAGGPYTLTVETVNKIVFEDVLIGEVWLGAGQSNMVWSAQMGIDNAEEETAKADYPEIRFFQVLHRTADTPQRDLDGQWVKCTPETFADFSAVAYYFGREIHQKVKVPVGIIHSSWGGTHAEVWLPKEIVENDEEFAPLAKRFEDQICCPNRPGKGYNAMIAPIMPYSIAGVIWYQGESNTGKHASYNRLFSALINSWRSGWDFEFPFYYVQIAPFKYEHEFTGAALRDAQRKTLALPKTGMVVTSDIGNIEDIHPQNKLDVGKRLALWALRDLYGFTDLVVSGPLFKEMKPESNGIRLYFNYADDGLVIKGKEATDFEVAGEDKVFYPAKAVVKENTIFVNSKNVKAPKAVRFAFKNTAEPNLFNKAGLPASTFRTDDWDFR